MVERCNESSSLDFCLAETETNHERRLKTATGEDFVTTTILEVSSNPVQKVAEREQTEKAAELRFGGSCRSTVDQAEKNTETHRLSHQMFDSVAEEATPLVNPAADILQRDSGASHKARQKQCETQETDFGHFSFTDNHGSTDSPDENNTEFLPQIMSETYHGGDSVESQHFMLHPPNDQTNTDSPTTTHQTALIAKGKEEKKLYYSVLHQMKEQQKHKPGRRFKKKTLMKMAKLFVIAKGWNSEEMETSEVRCSDGPLAECESLVLKQREDVLTSVSQSDTREANSPKLRENHSDKDTVSSTISADATFSGPTAAPQVRLKEKHKTSSSRKRQVKKESAESECNTPTYLLEKSDNTQGSLMCPTPAAASKQPRKPRKTGSVAFKEDTKVTRDNSELLENTSAETANVDPSKKPTSNRKKKTAKGGVKKRAKQKPLPETFTEHNDLMTQDDGGGFLESDFTQKSQKEATCTATTAEIPSEHPCESTEAAKKIKRKGGRALTIKAELFTQITSGSEQCNISNGEVLSFQPTSVFQASSRRRSKKKKTTSTACTRKASGANRSEVKSVEAIINPTVSANEEVLFHTGNQGCATQNSEDKTKPRRSSKKARKRRITTSRLKSKRGLRAVQQLPTEHISLQEHSNTETPYSSTAAVPSFTISQLQNQRKRAAKTKKCTEDAVSVPVCNPTVSANEEVLFHTGNQGCATQNSEDKTKPRRSSKKARKRRITTSRLKSKRGLRAVQQLPTEHISLQEHSNSETPYSSTAAVPSFTISQLQNQRKRAAKTKKCTEEAVSVPVCMPPCADSTVNQCAPAESLMQASDIKCEPTCEPVTPTLMIQRNTNTRRQRKKTAENGKATIALPVSVKEESKCADVQRDTTRRNHSEKKQKGRAQRKRRNIEDNASEQMLNSGLTTESEPPSEAAPKQLDFPLTNIKTELDSSLTDNPRPRRDRKLPRKYTPAQPKDCLISYLKGLRVKNRCPKGVKTELMVDEATYAIILDEVLKAQDKHTKSQNKNPPVQIIANPDETLNAAIKEELISSRTNDIVVKESVSKKIKDTRKRKGKRAKKKVVASFVEFDEAAAPNPPVSSLNENLEQEVVVKRKGRCKRVKSELPALSAVENDKDTKLEPEDNVSVSCQTTESENCVVTYVRASRRHQGSQRLKSKENKKTSAGSLSAAHTPQTVEVVSDLKNVLMVSFEVDREAPTGHLKSGKKDMTKGRKVRQTSKKKTFKGLRHLDSSEEQKPECDTGVLVNREMGVKSKIRSKRRKTKACTRFGKTSQIVKMENMFSCNEPVPACSSSIHDAAFDGVDLNTVKQEHNKSDVSELSPEEAPLSQDQPVHSDPPAAPEGKPKMKKIKKRRRRRKTRWAARKKLKRPQIIECSFPSDVEMSAFSFESSLCNSVSGDARISLTLEEESEDVKEKVTEQTQSDQADVMTANTKVKFSSKIKNYDPRCQKLKSQKPLKCSFCGRCFRHITAFTVHRRIHTGEKPYRCPTCGKNFARLYQLNLHSEIHNKSHAVCCPCCHAKFKNKDELILHFHSHMKDIQEDTTEEGAKHSQADSLDTPVGPSLNKPLRCSVCFKEFLKRATFKMHRRTRCGKPHTCSVCGKKFYQPSSLNVHEKTHWPVKPYSCTVCCRGFDKLQELKRHSQIHSGAAPFSCARCEKSFTTFALLRSHQMARACSDKQGRNRSDIDQFLVSQSAAVQFPTPVHLKCPICKQLHRHWCQYVLHLQTHTHSKSYTCETCRQQYDQAAEMRSHCLVCCRKSGEEEVCRASLGEMWEEPENVPQDEDQMGQITALPQVETGEKEEVTYMGSPPPSPHDSNPSENDDFDISPPPPNSDGSDFCLTSDQASQQPSGHQSPIHRHCGRYSCGHCGKSFNRWNKLWLHRRFHRQTHRPFSCAQCDLEFRFLGSYIDHLQEHAAQMPYACPLCPDTFANNENLTVHISESHKLQDFNKCSKCGKNFSTLRNLKKHKLLHKGATSHFCLPCNLSFSSHSALKTHLKTHRVRLNVPQPAWAVEPLLFPYHCKRCTAKFSSTDLLQAHQVCHFTGGKKPESPTENVAAYIPSRIPENIQAVGSASSQQKRRLPVSNKKHLFRYPHPDRLYVVPVISSEPPVVISDTEEESPSIVASASSTVSDLPHRPGASFSCSDSNCSNIPQSSSRTTSSQNRDHSDKSLFLPGSHQHQFFDVSRASDSDSLFSEEEELVEETHYCAICMETFTDISKLHEHYMAHARGI